MTQHITVIGGGLAGLTAAIACAETGAPVRLFEAHATLGGRGRATSGPYIAHDGAHVFYADGPHYTWLKARGFTAGLGWPAPRQMGRLGFRTGGRVRRIPPARMLRAQARFDLKPPVDIDFRSWASARWGEQTAEHIANAISVATYDADTGRLSAGSSGACSSEYSDPACPRCGGCAAAGSERWTGWSPGPANSVSRSAPVRGSTASTPPPDR